MLGPKFESRLSFFQTVLNLIFSICKMWLMVFSGTWADERGSVPGPGSQHFGLSLVNTQTYVPHYVDLRHRRDSLVGPVAVTFLGLCFPFFYSVPVTTVESQRNPGQMTKLCAY